MTESKFKSLRHMETVRNYINFVIRELLTRGEEHDQTKLQSPEVEIFEEYTPKLRHCSYGSNQYKQYMKEMRVGLDHHNEHSRHHPEHHPNGIEDMDLIDLIEMICDWRAASLRHDDGNVMKSILMNQERFGYSDELTAILLNTAQRLIDADVDHYADES